MLHSLKKILYFIALISCCPIYGHLSITFNEHARTIRAQSVGNKTANLEELTKVTNALNQEFKEGKKRFAVPSLFSIGHQEISNFLNNVLVKLSDENRGKASDIIAKQWEQFKQHQPNDAQTLNSQAKEALSIIRTAIESAFSDNLFFEPTLGQQQELESFVNGALKQQQLLMVRSTGREDSKEFANAGGNESVAAVQPGIFYISKAIGKVVASYFSERSFNQRLLALDKTDIFKDPFMPVLLQEMIGERPAKKDPIPVSGVMFSQEAQGQTRGVVSINAAWGHAEGIVNGLVATDQFLVGPIGTIHALVSPKIERIAADKNFQLEPITNTKQIQTIPSLSTDQINDLVLAARELEHYYNWPQDIEFVIQNNLIYLVQTRPIVSPATIPSHVKEKYLSTIQAADKKNMYVISAGGGSASIINETKNIIIADNIRKALDIFLDLKDKTSVQAIVVGQMAPATSHEATTFRGAGKSVFYTKDLAQVQRWVATNLPIVLDTQRGLIIRFVKHGQYEEPSDTLDQNSWLVHPLAKKTSLMRQFMPEQLKTTAQQLPRQENHKDISTTAVLKNLTNATTHAEVEKILATLHARIHKIMLAQKEQQAQLQDRHKETSSELLHQLVTIYNQFFTCADEIMQTPISTTRLERINWLYPLVFLEAIVRQVPNTQEFIDDYSLASVVKTEGQEQSIVKSLELPETSQLAHYVQLAKADKFALTDQIRQYWQYYIKNLHSIDPQMQAKVIEIAGEVASLDIMPLWLNISFFQAAKKGSYVNTCSQILIDEYEHSKEQIHQSWQLMQRIKTFSAKQFEKPENFTKAWNMFNKTLLSYFVDKDFPGKFDSAPQLAQFTMLTTMNKFVELFDTSIKALEGSSAYGDKNIQATRFKEMLEAYFGLLKNWSSIKSISTRLQSLLYQNDFATVDAYLNHIHDLLSVLVPTAAQLKFSRGFNVAAAALGSKANWSRSIGASSGRSDKTLAEILEQTKQQKLVTLDDLFTLIHQNLLVTIGLLFSDTEIKNLQLPPIPAALHTTLSSYTVTLNQVQTHTQTTVKQVCSWIGFSLENNILTYYYNMPVINHSNTFKLMYNLESQKTTFEVNFIGQARQRWAKIANWIVLFAAVWDLPFAKEPDIDDVRGILSFAIDINNQQIIPIIMSFLSTIQQFTIVDYREFQMTLPLKTIASLLVPQQQEQFVQYAINKFLTAIDANPALFVVLADLVHMVPLDNPTLTKIVSQLPTIAKTAPSSIRKNIFALFNMMHDDALSTMGFTGGLDPKNVLNFFATYFPQILDTIDVITTMANDPQEIKQIDRFFEVIPYRISMVAPFDHGYQLMLDYVLHAIKSPRVEQQTMAINILNHLLSSHKLDQSVKTAAFNLASQQVLSWIRDKHDNIQLAGYKTLKELNDHGQKLDLIVPAISHGIASENTSIKYESYSLFLKSLKKLDLLKGLSKKDVTNIFEYMQTRTRFVEIYKNINNLIAFSKAGIVKDYDTMLHDLLITVIKIGPHLYMGDLALCLNLLLDEQGTQATEQDHKDMQAAVFNKYINIADGYDRDEAQETIQSLHTDVGPINAMIEQWKTEHTV